MNTHYENLHSMVGDLVAESNSMPVEYILENYHLDIVRACLQGRLGEVIDLVNSETPNNNMTIIHEHIGSLRADTRWLNPYSVLMAASRLQGAGHKMSIDTLDIMLCGGTGDVAGDGLRRLQEYIGGMSDNRKIDAVAALSGILRSRVGKYPPSQGARDALGRLAHELVLEAFTSPMLNYNVQCLVSVVPSTMPAAAEALFRVPEAIYRDFVVPIAEYLHDSGRLRPLVTEYIETRHHLPQAIGLDQFLELVTSNPYIAPPDTGTTVLMDGASPKDAATLFANLTRYVDTYRIGVHTNKRCTRQSWDEHISYKDIPKKLWGVYQVGCAIADDRNFASNVRSCMVDVKASKDVLPATLMASVIYAGLLR